MSPAACGLVHWWHQHRKCSTLQWCIEYPLKPAKEKKMAVILARAGLTHHKLRDAVGHLGILLQCYALHCSTPVFRSTAATADHISRSAGVTAVSIQGIKYRSASSALALVSCVVPPLAPGIAQVTVTLLQVGSSPAMGCHLLLIHALQSQQGVSTPQMMHSGWDLEKPRWEERTRASRSVQDIGNALAHLEDWIALDYPPGSDVCSSTLPPMITCVL